MKIFAGVDKLERMLDYHMERHTVLATNLSNAETPNYRARDLVFEQELDLALAGGMARTNDAHLPAIQGGASDSQNYTLVESEPTGADQNDVRLEKAMAQISANKIKYELGVEIARKRLGLLRYAATDGGR